MRAVKMNDEKENETDGNEFDFSKEREIYTSIGDPEIKGLYDKYKRKRLIIQPKFQRQFVWDATKSSQLMESALLRIPLPVVYLSEEEDGKLSVIDGQQRLTAFFSFIDGIFPDGKEFKLSGLKIFTEHNKKKFADLPEKDQERISECKIRAITFGQNSNEDLKFEVFERLNSGSVKLNDQELRNCIYRGAYNDLLRDLSKDKDYMKIMGYSKPHKRMLDIEYVLRFASFYHQTYLNYSAPMKKFMNKEMEARQDISDADADELKKSFKNSVSVINSLLGETAFKKFTAGAKEDPSGRWDKGKFNASLFDILMWSFSNKDKNLLMNNLDSIKEGLIDLMTTNQNFIESILIATSNKNRVLQRFDIWRKSLDQILKNQTKQPRCFSRALKQEFYDKNSTCKLCKNHINHIDDAAMDHAEQYWKGGQTIPENARLVHRYCNNTRARKDDHKN